MLCMMLQRMQPAGLARRQAQAAPDNIPLMAAAMARAMPVFPEVASMSVSPGRIRPWRSASVIMLRAGLHPSHQGPCCLDHPSSQYKQDERRAARWASTCP